MIIKNKKNEIIFDGKVLRGANLQEANLQEANLQEANLRGVDLQEANLQEANLRGVDLRGANFYGAYLREANLLGANLRGANLRKADLQGANLRGVNLRGAMLEGLLQINGSKHFFQYYSNWIKIGCVAYTIDYWLAHYREIGVSNAYNRDQQEEYYQYIKIAEQLKLRRF